MSTSVTNYSTLYDTTGKIQLKKLCTNGFKPDPRGIINEEYFQILMFQNNKLLIVDTVPARLLRDSHLNLEIETL